MVQAEISDYLKNSDFTTQKQKSAYDLTLNVPAGTYSYGQTFRAYAGVTPGVYFENVTLSSTLKPAEYYPTNYAVILENVDSIVYVAVYQNSSGQYALQATLMGSGGSPQVSTGGFTVNAKVHLSVSPFE